MEILKGGGCVFVYRYKTIIYVNDLMSKIGNFILCSVSEVLLCSYLSQIFLALVLCECLCGSCCEHTHVFMVSLDTTIGQVGTLSLLTIGITIS